MSAILRLGALFLVVVVCFECTSALKCYTVRGQQQAKEEKNDGAVDECKPAGFMSVDQKCTREGKDKDTKYAARCIRYHRTYKIGGVTNYEAFCGYEGYCKKPELQMDKLGCAECDSDYCNSSGQIKYGMLLPIALLLAFIGKHLA